MEEQGQTSTPSTASLPKAGPSTGLLIDLDGAADFLGLTEWQIRGLITTGELKVVKVGKKFYFLRRSLTRWAEKAEQ